MTLMKRSLMGFGALLISASMACVAAESPVCSNQPLAAETPSIPKRIAIAIGKFENKSTMPDSAFESLRARMQQCVAGTRKFHVQDREHLKALLREQALAAAGIVDGNNAEAPEGGKLEFASYMIYGTVQSCITDSSNGNLNGVGYAMFRSKIELFIKLVDPETGRILTTKTACGHGVDKLMVADKSITRQGVNKAIDEACHAVAYWLRDYFACPPKVLKACKGEIIVDLTDSEAKEGDVFDVIDAKELGVDADTGASLGLGGSTVGRICIESTGSHTSNAKPIADKKGNVLDLGSLDTAGHTYILRRVNKAMSK